MMMRTESGKGEDTDDVDFFFQRQKVTGHDRRWVQRMSTTDFFCQTEQNLLARGTLQNETEAEECQYRVSI